MVILQIILSTLAIVSAMTSLFFAYRATDIVRRAEARRANQPKEKKYVVPNKGVFSRPPKRKKPKYVSEEDQWVMEQDGQKRR